MSDTRGPKRRTVASLFALAFAFACVSVYDEGDRERRLQPERGAVVSEHRLATAVGLEILERGGNAVDAAVATAFALAVVYPQAGNLGGGGFAVVVPHAGVPECLDFRETTPAGYDIELYYRTRDGASELVRERSLLGPLAVGVPGSPHGLWTLHRRHGSGRVPFADLLRPAIRLAREGFAVDPILAELLADPQQRAKLEHGAATELFYPRGRPLAAGEVLVQSKLARTLERIADGGARAFYRGAPAKAVVEELARTPLPDPDGGLLPLARGMSEDDLRSFEPRWRDPLRGWFRGYEVITMPPPSSGGVCLLQLLAILDGFPLDAELRRAADDDGTLAVVCGSAGVSERMMHWWIEAMRRSFADRAQHLGDPDFVDVPLAELLSRDWIAERRITVGEQAALDVEPMPPPMRDPFVPLDSAAGEAREGTQTTHLSVLDGEGNAVALTTTLNSWFGSGIYVRDAGFFLNNELDDFALPAGTPNQFGLVGSAANALAPGKRPLSSMTPTVLRDHRGVVRYVLGSPGGPKIISSLAQVVLRTLVLGEALEAAVAAPRLHQQWRPAETQFERGWNPAALEALRVNRRHPVVEAASTFGSVQAIAVDERGRVLGASDPRRGGVAGVQGERLPPPRAEVRTAEQLREHEPPR